MPAAHLDLHGSQMAAGDDFLPERAQQVKGEHAAQQHDLVDAELAGGQLLGVEVTLQFAVEMFAGARLCQPASPALMPTKTVFDLILKCPGKRPGFFFCYRSQHRVAIG